MKAKIAYYLLLLLNIVSYLTVAVDNILYENTFLPNEGTYVLTGLLVFLSIFIILRNKVWKGLLALLLIGMTFSDWFLPFGVSVGEVQVIGLLLLIVHFAANPKLRDALFMRFVRSESKRDEIVKRRVERFMKRFEGREEDELLAIIEDDARAEEAKMAARNLLRK